MPLDDWRRFVAPAAFLLAATIAIVLIRAGIDSGQDHKSTSTVVVPVPPQKRVSTTGSKAKSRSTSTSTTTTAGRQFWTVQAGDTFSVIASKSGVSVATIETLNPNASSTTLHIGEKIRVR
jgi:LysM repeat protein